MRILLVEDHFDFAESIEKSIRSIAGCDVTWTQSRSSALTALEEEPFDVVLLDRNIPSDDGILDGDDSHGWDVFQQIRERFPGTSVWFLTATVDADFAIHLLNEYGRNGDIHACGGNDTVYRVFWKRQMTDCIAHVRAFREEVRRTEEVNLSQIGDPVNLRREEERLLRLFGRSHGGASVETRILSGGLSGARVLQVAVHNTGGKPLLTSIGKIGDFREIGKERERYRNEIARLVPGSTPQVTAELDLGASGYVGIFYGAVGTEVTDLFTKLTLDPAGAADIPGRLRTAQAPWHNASSVERMRVGAVRRRLIGDVTLASVQHELQDIDITTVEMKEIDVALCVQHGDLHCANVLFDDRGHPMLIDYPDTGQAFACLDPVALELSTIFHKNAPDRHGWPGQVEADNWKDITVFAAGAPFEAYLKACRDWSIAVAGSEQEVWAVGYAYALRQLKYDDTDKALARAIIIACIAALSDAPN
ncbi:response regulator (plasmid) [Phaeobacter inhibens]|uniref:response regulator n=1 Tax=Phaeobacter inhibens TaxID=221822 RepID=UPI0021A327A6|nr:response regulator [Phaeobacter inhibens]UWR86383.1 response regulator [Phaeobacter inhibens]